MQRRTKILTVGFWSQTIHKKFLGRFDTIFGLKMMMKSGVEKIILKFRVAAAQIWPEGLQVSLKVTVEFQNIFF